MTIKNCTAPWDMTHVNVNGDVPPCCNGAGVVGNLRHQSFADIWNGETMHSIRQHITNGEIHPICACETCPYQHHNPGVSVPAEVIPFNPHCVEPKSNRYKGKGVNPYCLTREKGSILTV